MWRVAQQVGFNIPLRSIFKPSYSRNSLNTNVTNHAVAPWTNSPSIYKVWVKNSPHRQLRIARSAKFFLHLDKGELGKPKSRKILCTPTKKLTVRRQFGDVGEDFTPQTIN